MLKESQANTIIVAFIFSLYFTDKLISAILYVREMPLEISIVSFVLLVILYLQCSWFHDQIFLIANINIIIGLHLIDMWC